ncbi:GumC family protein [Salinimicrobium gaetbulicola]|uniref:non-specific protein-tyrosine kinase n=1 Tax=Salinimicrobium gaetbulicola TaxID=999702 RepID=A0ABW3IE16_9FLAO
MAQHYPTSVQEDEMNLQEELQKHLRYWPWFLACILTALAICFVLLKFMTPVYPTTATILIKEGEKNPASGIEAFTELGLLGGMNTNSIENEIGILRSYRLMESVIKELNLHVRYFESGLFQNRELYSNSPVTAQVLNINKSKFSQLEEASESSFRIEFKDDRSLEVFRLSDEKRYKTGFNEPVDLGFAMVSFRRNETVFEVQELEGPLMVSINLPEKVADIYQEKLSIQLIEKNASLIELQLQDPVREKARDILDQLVRAYNREAIEDKNILALNTADFINERLSIINEELASVETGKVEFKENNGLTDLQAESQLFMTSATENKKRQQELATQIELADAILEFMQTGSSSGLLPANLGIDENMVNEEINGYNELILERNRILKGSTEKNPVIITLNEQIDELKANIFHSLTRLRSNLKIAQDNLNRETAVIGSKIAAVPVKEMEYRNIERQQQIKESLYLFLLQKREENSLSLAATAPKAKIVDHARSSDIPVSPKPKIMFLAALILGMLVPFLVIYLKNLLNNKVRSRHDLEAHLKNFPIIGELPKINKGNPELIQQNDRSMLAEAFRILQHNLQYLLVKTTSKNNGSCIMVTSSIKGEGKTFTSFNLGITLAHSGKKVILLGADLRNPQLQRFIPESAGHRGISDFLVDPDLDLEELIRPSGQHERFDVMASGSIPPNPTELLSRPALKTLIEKLEDLYDYVIIDSAPTMPVVDSFLITGHVDLNLYVVRTNYTDRKLLDFVAHAKEEGKIENIGIILNDLDSSEFGYGNKYGYTYGEETVPLWKRITRRAAFWSL